MRRQTSWITQSGDTAKLRKQGFAVYRYFKDVPKELATATALKKKGLSITDETPVVDYVLSGDARKIYCLFWADDKTLKQKKSTPSEFTEKLL